MKIIQMVLSLTYGDGISNCILSISHMLDEMDYPNIIIAFNVDGRIQNRNVIKGDLYEPITADRDDIIIYHFGIGCTLNYVVEQLPFKKILVYQNVTTPDFFRGVDDATFRSCLWGVHDAAKTVGRYLKVIVMSEYNKGDLIKMGWKPEDISVLPLVKLEDTHLEMNQKTVEKYSDGFVNILFTGRIAPNKKIEDVIKIFAYYQKNINHQSRLLLVGSLGHQNYYMALIGYMQMLEVENVVFAGHVSNEDLEAYYAVSSVFLCMSEHEGFCIPLVEAMKREIPILAYSATAVPDTLGGAGVLVDTKDERELGKIIDRLVSDVDYRENIINKQNNRSRMLGIENHKAELKRIIDETGQIKEYSYHLESKEISIKYPVRQKANCLGSLGDLYQKKENIVIYGLGKVGKAVVAECESYGKDLWKKIIICDNYFQAEYFKGIPVLKHRECIGKYPGALYIITVQDACVDIIAELIDSGIEKQNIKFYNSSASKVV